MKRLIPLALTGSMAILTACGGGGGGTDVAEGGMGGTGISQGPVTGFGSVYVNGVKYETDNAVFERDGVETFVQGDFALGEYVTVEGSVNTDGATGVATKVSYSTLLEGPVSSVDGAADTLEILGQTVQLDALTVRAGFTLLDELQPGNMIEVSGIQTASGHIAATVVSFESSAFIAGQSELEFYGNISSVDVASMQFIVNGLIVDFRESGFPAGSPSVGTLVEVESAQVLTNNTVVASRIELESAVNYSDNTELEIQGSITSFDSQQSFAVSGVPVSTDASTEFEDGLASLLALGVRVEVEGKIIDGILEAEEVSIREAQSSVEFEGAILSIDSSNQSFVLSGNKTILVDAATMLINEDSDLNFSFADLQTGEVVEIYGNELAGGAIRATKVEREDEDDEEGKLEWEGIVGNVDSTSFTLTLIGITVTTAENTEFEADGDISRDAFFALLQPNETKIKVEGSMTGDNILNATKIELDD